MKTALNVALLGLFVLGVSAQSLDKPPLHPNLDYCMDGLNNNLGYARRNAPNALPKGQLPAACRDETQNLGLDPNDVTAYSVTYHDCDAPWLVCRHKGSPVTLANMLLLFARLPVHTRQWVRHLLLVPADGDSAYNTGGNVVILQNAANINVYIHEAAHSLDGYGAYGYTELNDSPRWLNAYNRDTAVPDPYAQTNQAENVAQNTVVTTYDLNVPGGFKTIEPNASRIANQMRLLKVLSANASSGPLLTKGGKCKSRLSNDPITTSSGRVSSSMAFYDTSIPAGIEVIAPRNFTTKGKCKFH